MSGPTDRGDTKRTGTTGTPGAPSASGSSSPVKSGYASRTLPNIAAVSRREIGSRIRTRAYRFTTAFLIVLGVGLALVPTIIQLVDQGSSGERVEVVAGDALPGVDAAAAFQQLLDATAGGPSIPTNGADAPSRFTVAAAADIETARQHVVDGTAAAALALGRDATGDLTFDLYSNDGALSITNALIRQAAGSIAIQDRLNRAGVPPVDQATLFLPPSFDLLAPDPSNPATPDPTDDASGYLTGFGMSMAIFLAIILYGTWIAYGVAEEKSSRVMEIVLAAATPFQLLAGKVVGIGALAILQYLIVAVPTILVLVFQGQISELLLGGGAAPGVPGVPGPDIGAGLTVPLVLTFGVMLVLGFAVYASLYGGAASLVSRQEDINQIVAPLTILSGLGYIVATYAGTGLIPLDSPLVIILSFVPLFSPYLMLTRLASGTAEPWEVLVATGLLMLTVPLALWIAARLYRSGVLMYGQPPSPRTLWRAFRAG